MNSNQARDDSLMNFSKIKNKGMAQNDVAKHGILYMGSRVGVKVLSFMMIPIWTRFLSPDEYGVIGLVMAYAGMAGALLLLGLPSAIIRHYHDYQEEWSGYIKTIFGYALGALLLIYVGMNVLNIVLQETGPDLIERYRNVFWVTLAGGVLGQLAIAGVQAERASKLFVVGGFVSYFVGLTLSLLFVILVGMGAKGFLLGMGLGSLIGVAYIIWNRRRTWLIAEGGQVKLQYLKKGLKYGALLLPTTLSIWVINFVGRIVVEDYHGLSEVGLFSFAGNLAMVMSFVMISLVQAWEPSYYALRKKGELQEINRACQHIDGFATQTALFVLIGVSMMAAPVLSILVSDKYEPSFIMITPLCVGYLFYGFISLETRGFMYHGKSVKVSIVYVIAAGMVLLGSWLVVPEYGGYGACLTSMCAMAVTTAVAMTMNRVSGEKILSVRSYLLVLVVGGMCLIGDRILDISGLNAWIFRMAFTLSLLAVGFISMKYTNKKGRASDTNQ